ncbi:MAG: YciI family protein [Pseudomonadota bacterium]
MKYIILFEDAPDADPDIRKTHMAAHLEFLEAHSTQIEAAGPLNDLDKAGRDGLWIVEAEAAEVVHTLVQADPFWPTGLRKSYAVIPWKQVFADGARRIQRA